MTTAAHAYRDGDTELRALVARPSAAPRGAVLVFPTIMNHSANALRRLPMLVDAGYLAVLADLYGRQPEGPGEAQALAAQLRAPWSRYRARIAAAQRAFDQIVVDASLARFAIGYCMGGQAALEAARMNLRFDAVVSFHGLLSTEQRAEGAIDARILVCHGEADPLAPRADVLAFWDEMNGARARWHFHAYGGVKHGFTDPEADRRGLDALGYDASADRQSWAAMLALFDEIIER